MLLWRRLFCPHVYHGWCTFGLFDLQQRSDLVHRFVLVRERGLVSGSGKRPDDHHHHGRRRHPQIEVCMHATSDCSDTPQQCSTFTEENIKETCGPGDSVLGGDSVTGASNRATSRAKTTPSRSNNSIA